MTTINSYSVSLALDASQYIKGSSLTRQETAKLRRNINASRTPLENHALAISHLEKAFKEGAIELGVFNRLVEQENQKLQAATLAAKKKADAERSARMQVSAGEKSLRASNAELRRQRANLEEVSRASKKASLGAKGVVGRLTGLAAGYISVGKAVRFVADSIQKAAQKEQSLVALEVLIKDADKAHRTLRQLQEFAAKSPFQQSEILQAGKSLLAFGFATRELSTRLQRFGNIAAATGTPVTELTRELGKMHRQHVIYSQDLNQLTGRGIDVLTGLAQQLGTTTDQVKKFASQGQINFSMLDKVLTDIANNEFGGMMAKQAETMAGKWSTLNDEISQTKVLIGEMLSGGGQGLGGATSTLGKFREGLDILFGGRIGRMQSEAQARADESALALARARNRKGGRINTRGLAERIREKQFRQFWDNSRFYVQHHAGKELKTQMGGAGMAGRALMAGFQQLGTTIAGSFQFHTEKLAQKMDTSLAPAMEAGSAEAAQAILQAQARQMKESMRQGEDKAERQRQSLVTNADKQSGILEALLDIWQGGDGPARKIR